MGTVESQMLAYLERCLAEGRHSVPAREIVDAVVPTEHPEWRHRPEYRHGLERLHRRLVINAVDEPHRTRRYFIGNYPFAELRASLGL